MKNVFDVVKDRNEHTVEIDFFLNLSLNIVRTDFGERLQVVFNGVSDGVFFKFDWVEAKKC